MTFEQAIIKKNTFQSASIKKDQMTFYIFVTPSKDADFKRYLNEIRGFFDHLKDEDAKGYSSNDLYSVTGLCMDGIDIVYIRL